ncbi:hypothetical protein HNY73_007290 [Argiope bruennichi]|uniref:Uncharacterized protein n=1 Tax=Argiope bruennichi TaxID=94029 RepID=A0A8T0FIJ4_ARGBR|nr:hypothetical protein HNY73_007290 [Argiope bruennichi]
MEDVALSFDNSRGILETEDLLKLRRCGLIHCNLVRAWEKITFLDILLDYAFFQICNSGNSNYVNENSIRDRKQSIDDLVERAKSYHQVVGNQKHLINVNRLFLERN